MEYHKNVLYMHTEEEAVISVCGSSCGAVLWIFLYPQRCNYFYSLWSVWRNQCAIYWICFNSIKFCFICIGLNHNICHLRELYIGTIPPRAPLDDSREEETFIHCGNCNLELPITWTLWELEGWSVLICFSAALYKLGSKVHLKMSDSKTCTDISLL